MLNTKLRVNFRPKLVFSGKQLAYSPSKVNGFRKIHAKELAKIILEEEMKLHPKHAVRNTSILLGRLGVLDGEEKRFRELATKYKISAPRVRMIFSRMKNYALRNKEIREELLALAGKKEK